MGWLRAYGPGLMFVFGLALLSFSLGSLFPVIGGPVFGIVIGMIVNHVWGKPDSTLKGILFSSKKVLQWAIILLGGGLSLSVVWHTGIESLYVMLITLAVAFVAAYGLGKLMKIPTNLCSLIAVGTGICGGSAIAAISPIIKAKETEIAYAISTIFLFNIIAVLVFPPLGHLMNFSDEAFGMWAGTAINDTSSVVAAGYIYSSEAGDYATIVKLTRTTMIIPIAMLFAFVVSAKLKREAAAKDETAGYSLKKLFPWFIVWFLVASLFNTMGIIDGDAVYYLNLIAKFMIIMALCAIGLSADFRKMMKTGIKPMILGLAVWFIVSAVSVVVQWISGSI